MQMKPNKNTSDEVCARTTAPRLRNDCGIIGFNPSCHICDCWSHVNWAANARIPAKRAFDTLSIVGAPSRSNSARSIVQVRAARIRPAVIADQNGAACYNIVERWKNNNKHLPHNLPFTYFTALHNHWGTVTCLSASIYVFSESKNSNLEACALGFIVRVSWIQISLVARCGAMFLSHDAKPNSSQKVLNKTDMS